MYSINFCYFFVLIATLFYVIINVMCPNSSLKCNNLIWKFSFQRYYYLYSLHSYHISFVHFVNTTSVISCAILNMINTKYNRYAIANNSVTDPGVRGIRQ